MMRKNVRSGTGAKYCGSIEQAAIERFERGHQRLHGKWKAIEQRSENQSCEGEGQRMAE